MQQHIRKVKTGGRKPIKLVIKLKRHPGKRMPIERIKRGQCPFQTVKSRSFLNVRIGRDVIVIVNIDKLEIPATGLSIDEEYRGQQCHADQGKVPP